MQSPGDTTVVQAFTYGSPQDAWFIFPSDTVHYEKILMLYTLKCNPSQSPACGEWDYLTYTYLYKHTGLIDSSVVHQPVFKINGNIVDSLSYSNSPTYSYSGNWQYYTVHDSTASLNTDTSGTGTIPLNIPFGTVQPVSRSQFLWKASELTALGMGAGNITGLQFNIFTAGSMMNNLTIRIKSTTLDSLTQDSIQTSGFTQVYKFNTLFPATGWNSLQFLTPFHWDGVSNIIIEITYDNMTAGTDNVVHATDAGYHAGLFKAGTDRAAGFHNGAYINIPVNDSLLKIDSVITVSFWAYGNPQYQPQAGTAFEAIDSNNNRVINVHLPWSDSNIYWDAGNTGSSYDRINKTATTNEIKGQWNYWTFIKNAATGKQKIYLNGKLWDSGTGLTRTMQPIHQFQIGKGNWSGSNSYEGRIDEYSVFNAELDTNTIRAYINKPIDITHPYYNKLVLYYHFDDGNYLTAHDAAPGSHQDAMLFSVDNPLKNSSDYVYGLTQTNFRPNVIFEQGVYISHIDSVFVPDSIVNVPIQIVTYTDSINHPGAAVDTFNVWPAGYFKYVYANNGAIIDSIIIKPDSVLHLTYYNYYNYFPQVLRYELARYITPYGNGLSLGNGFTWTFDVTDYRPLLVDSVELAAGNWQELLDMKFLMIHGTPPRDVLSIQNIYSGSYTFGDPTHPIDYYLTPRKMFIPPNTKTARWKSRVTGHGMDTPDDCAEFCPKEHYYKINDSLRFQQLVWRTTCDVNPVYPQGGTWVYSRSNWCPGAEVGTYDWEITPYITPGDSIKLDHDVQPYISTGGWHDYVIEDQLITYGSPNFTLDAAIDKVLSPTTDPMWGRHNPICTKPTVIIKNNGSTDLTSLTINYGITGNIPSIYNWTGLLHFQQTDTVVLDTFAWKQAASTFTIAISNPNGGIDQYPYNNTVVTPWVYVPLLPSRFIIDLKTNSWAYEDSYELRDGAGNLVFSRNNLNSNTSYRDTMNLANGCYVFKMIDTGGDGLTWWANTNQGSGSLRFRSATTGQVYKNFNSDFGGEVYMQFTVGLTNGIADYVFTDHAELKVYPNPVSKNLNIDIDLPSRQSGMVQITDLFGKIVRTSSFSNETAVAIVADVSGLPSGIYFVILRTDNDVLTKKVVVH